MPIMPQLLAVLLGLFLQTRATAAADAHFNAPPGIDIWCGKAYRPANASFEPGGWLDEPPRSAEPRLNVQFYTRMNIYTEGEAFGTFVVDAALSHTVGEPYHPDVFNKETNETSAFSHLYVDIAVTDSGLALVSNRNVSVGSTGTEFRFTLKGGKLKPRKEPYNVTLTGASVDGAQTYERTAELIYLPARKDGGSVAKVDRLYGGMYAQDYRAHATDYTGIVPYSFYVSWDEFVIKGDVVKNTHLFRDYGYNLIHVVPNEHLANQTFDAVFFTTFLDTCDALGLRVMYDMRYTYKNLSYVREQVALVKDHPSLLLWYTGDEPDGAGDTLNATADTYALLRELDPYHPVSLCLNCYNFHYGAYTAGTDIVMSDVYPIAVNTSFSTRYGTVCNDTYGCCGCDDCEGKFEDITVRLDRFQHYQEWLGQTPRSFWGVPQSFGNETFWARYPTSDEEAVMAVLSLNHGAKGIVAWNWPTQPHLADVTSRLAHTVTRGDVSACLLGANPVALKVAGRDRVDAAAWVLKGERKMLVSIVSMEYVDTPENVTVTLPVPAKEIKSVEWGPDGWTVSGNTLWKHGTKELEVSLLVLGL